jgi:LmbE family N-acetylglucosaminyl deacetylase
MPFCSEALKSVLTAILEELQPQYLLYPHPDDDHGDHRATAAFAKDALARMPDARPLWIGRYLIHHGRWPLPHGFRAATNLKPPDDLITAREWVQHPVDPQALRAKARALQAHGSQHFWAADLFGAHLRTNELFSPEIRGA